MRHISLKHNQFFVCSAPPLRLYSPKILTVLILLFSISPTYIPGYSGVRPCITLIPVFYWAVCRPQDFTISNAFMTGLFLDLLDGVPLGVNTVVFTLFYFITQRQYRYLIGRLFSFVWLYFAVLAFGAYVLKWLLISLYYATFMPVALSFVSYILLIISYPIISWPCIRLNLYLMDKEK